MNARLVLYDRCWLVKIIKLRKRPLESSIFCFSLFTSGHTIILLRLVQQSFIQCFDDADEALVLKLLRFGNSLKVIDFYRLNTR